MRGTALVLLLATLALAHVSTYAPFVRRDGVPPNSGWTMLDRADPKQKITFTIVLKQQNLDELERRFWANSDPTHADFGKHMRKEEITALIAPSEEIQNKVLSWIKVAASSVPSGHVFSVDNQQDAIKVVCTVRFVEKLFNTEMRVFQNSRNNMIHFAHIGDLNVAADIHDDIAMISGITELPPVNVQKEKKVEKRQSGGNNQCNNPYTIKNLYNVPQDLKITNNVSSASIYAMALNGPQEGFGLSAVEEYQRALDIPINPITCVLGNAAADYEIGDDDGEAEMDTQLFTGIAVNGFTCFWIMQSGNGWFYEFTREVFVAPVFTPVISISYSWFEDSQCMSEIDNCTALHIPNSQTYVAQTNIQFQKLGLLGHSILIASGDDGVAGGHQSENGCQTQGPQYPSSSPYVTSVGATSVEISTNDDFDWRLDAKIPSICTNATYQCACSTSTNEQVALSNNSAGFDSGGGFSFYSAQPAYQNNAVNRYIKSGVVLPTGFFNPKNRGYPDVASVGANICLLSPGSNCAPGTLEGGTSAAAPTWAALTALLNNDRIAAGKGWLGFLNPILYKMFDSNPTQYFNNGFAHGNNAGECPSNMGFNAWPGEWTPITGLGSPKFDQIRKYVAGLP